MEVRTDNRTISGVSQALFGYCWWGFVTAYFYHQLRGPNVLDLLSWRVLSALPIVLVVLYFSRSMPRLKEAMTSWSNIRWLLLSAFLILVNWLVYIWAVVSDQLVDASLGYYLNPLVSVALGAFVLRERLRLVQSIAVLVALVGVVVFTVMVGHLPWIALALAVSFPLYGLIRKKCPTDALVGLTVELIIIFPLMISLTLFFVSRGESVFQTGTQLQGWLTPLSGIVTIVPLVCYSAAARKLKFSTVGMLQYIAPTGQLLSAVLLFGEEMAIQNWVVFVCVWLAIILYSADSIVHHGTRNDQRRSSP